MTTRLGGSPDCEAIVIGAGPYGLAVAAHLKARQISTRVFGKSMAFWRHNMPKGMRLRSPWSATNISDPAATLSLDAYTAGHGMTRAEPYPLDSFVGYGTWFQSRAVPDLDRRMVTRLEATDGGFRATTADGDAVTSRRVIVATGLAHQEFRPAAFANVPAELASHTSDHDDLAIFRGKRIAVVGRGQSACESAVLLTEAGAEVEMICRGPIHWLGSGQPAISWPQRVKRNLSAMLATPSGVGPFPLNWVVEAPQFVRRLPPDALAWFNAASLKPGAAAWLRPRFGGVHVSPGLDIVNAAPKGERIELKFARRTALFDHVLLATGYRYDVAKVGFLDGALRARIAHRAGSPLLSAGFESSVPGLHFVGSSAVGSIGPLMRFIAGTAFAARQVARAVALHRGARSQARDTTTDRGLAGATIPRT
jgi:hypothetical protein